jgi:hypothetical protein
MFFEEFDYINLSKVFLSKFEAVPYFSEIIPFSLFFQKVKLRSKNSHAPWGDSYQCSNCFS